MRVFMCQIGLLHCFDLMTDNGLKSKQNPKNDLTVQNTDQKLFDTTLLDNLSCKIFRVTSLEYPPRMTMTQMDDGSIK
jgi:hypothetical protein